MVAEKILETDKDLLTTIFENEAVNREVKLFFEEVILSTSWPPEWKNDRIQQLKGLSKLDTQRLIKFASSHHTIPGDPQLTALGSLLLELTPYLDQEGRIFTAVLISKYDLIRDADLVRSHRARYQIPDVAEIKSGVERVYGPPFEWIEPEDDVYPESVFKTVQDFTMDFLITATKRAKSVCQVQVPAKERYGTGFVIGPCLVLTNFHNIKRGQEDFDENLDSAFLRFGHYKAQIGEEKDGQVINLDPNEPWIERSPWEKLDFVLLRTEKALDAIEGISPIPFTLDIPHKNSSLNILQHPDGEEMKVSLARNGVTWVSTEKNRMMYVTHTAGGSSGSPCFNNNWELVGLHHAGIEETILKKGRAILIPPIFEKIKDHLS